MSDGTDTSAANTSKPLTQSTSESKDMLLEQTRNQLCTLKLTGFLEALEQQLEQPHSHEMAFEQRLGMLIEREVIYRDNRRLARLLSNAKLREQACVEDINYAHPRGLDKSHMASLVQLDWVRGGLNLCVTGKTGCGKTWLACAFGSQSCRQGLVTRYFRLPRLLEQLRISHGDCSYARLMIQLLKTDLLILDDWGMQPLEASQRQDLMELIEDRHGRHSTLIASQLPVKHWHDYIGEATMSDAILDRLLHGSHRMELTGESMRKLAASDTGNSKNNLTDRDRSK